MLFLMSSLRNAAVLTPQYMIIMVFIGRQNVLWKEKQDVLYMIM